MNSLLRAEGVIDGCAFEFDHCGRGDDGQYQEQILRVETPNWRGDGDRQLVLCLGGCGDACGQVLGDWNICGSQPDRVCSAGDLVHAGSDTGGSTG